MIADYGGLAKVMPALRGRCSWSSRSSSVGLPGTNGFVGEFLILHRHVQDPGGWRIRAAFAATGVILGAALHALAGASACVFGQIATRRTSSLKDLSFREWLTSAALLVLVLVMGLCPAALPRAREAPVERWVQQRRAGESGDGR